MTFLDRSLPGSSVHGILQAWILEWIAILCSRGSSQPRNQTRVSYISCIGRRVLYPTFQVRTCQMTYPPRITQPKGDRSTFILFCKKCFLSLYTGRFDLLTNLSRDTHCSSAFQATMRLVSSKLAIEWSLGQCTYFPSKHLFFSFRWFF